MDSIGIHKLNSKQIEISVITPVYNEEKYIRETVDSILDLAPKTGFEYIVVNDGSTDGTLAILESYGNRIKLINQLNQGESSAVNSGIYAASGDYLVVISADDPIHTSKLFEGVQEFFAANPGVSAWYPNWRMIDENSELIRVVVPEEYSVKNLVGRAICLPGPGTFFRRKMAIEIGGRQVKWRYVADYDFWLRISVLGPLQKRNEVLAQWRYHDQSTSVASAGYQMFRERVQVIEQFVEDKNFEKKMRRMALANTRCLAASIKFESKVSIPARREVLRAILIRRYWPEELRLENLFAIFVSSNFHPRQKIRRLLKITPQNQS